VNPESIQGPLEIFSVLLFSVLFENFGLDILPIISDPTVCCTHLEADYELVILVAIIFRVFTQSDGEGESSLHLGQMLVKFTQAPWRVIHISHRKGTFTIE
jgi:hypothetical protein